MLLCMDWNAPKFDWNRARAFLVTAEQGSLSAAARTLGMTQPTLGRQVEALETELNVVLFERIGRGMTLTPCGLELLEYVRTMGKAAGEMSFAARDYSQSIKGRICISASETYATHLLPPIIKKIHQAEPDIEIEIIATVNTSDLRRREADIAIRNFRPTEPDLIAKKIKDIPARLYATPEYLAQIGNPTTIEDLSQAQFIAIDNHHSVMKGLNHTGFNLTENNFPFITENFLVMWEMVKQGIAIGVLDGHIGDREPKVVQVLPDMPPLIFPIWLVAHRELNTNKRIRLVFNLLADELKKLA